MWETAAIRLPSQLNSPGAVALDSKGNIYIADTGNQRIRKISVSAARSPPSPARGTIGYSGDGAAATAATLNAPSGLAFDSSDNLYIADTANNVIRKITGTTVTTVAGDNGVGPGYGGDGGAATSANLNGPTAVALDAQGNLYIADTGNSLIRKVDVQDEYHHDLCGWHRRHSRHCRQIERSQRAVVRSERRALYRRFRQRSA